MLSLAKLRRRHMTHEMIARETSPALSGKPAIPRPNRTRTDRPERGLTRAREGAHSSVVVSSNAPRREGNEMTKQ